MSKELTDKESRRIRRAAMRLLWEGGLEASINVEPLRESETEYRWSIDVKVDDELTFAQMELISDIFDTKKINVGSTVEVDSHPTFGGVMSKEYTLRVYDALIYG